MQVQAISSTRVGQIHHNYKVTNLANNLLIHNVVMLHIKFKGVKRTTTYLSIYFDITLTLDPRGGVKRSKQFFSESGHAAYQIKGSGVHQHASNFYLALVHTLDPWDGVKR